jgi:hypothetical protein
VATFAGQGAHITPMQDADHYRHFSNFLNPPTQRILLWIQATPSIRNTASTKTAGTRKVLLRRILVSGWMVFATRSLS